MAAARAWWRHPCLPSKRYQRMATRKLIVRFLLIVAFLAVVPPLLFHFWLRRAAEVKSRKCGWLESAPLVCAHGGDSNRAFPNIIQQLHPGFKFPNNNQDIWAPSVTEALKKSFRTRMLDS